MEISILLIEKIAAMFLAAVVGFIIVRIKLLKVEDSMPMSILITYIISPCITFQAFLLDFTASRMKGLMLAFVAAIIVHVLFITTSKLMEKPCHLNSIDKASIDYSNSGYLIIPLVTYVMGKEWVFYTSAYTIVMTVLLWTHCVALVSEEKAWDFKKIILNPNVIAMILGMIFMVTGWRLPTVLNECVDGFSVMIANLSMFVVGMLFATVDFKSIFANKKVYLICLMRLIILPLIAILIFKEIGLAQMHPEGKQILLVVFLATSAPVAVMITQLAQIYEKDSVYASAINVMSVIFCIATMPAMVLLFQYLI